MPFRNPRKESPSDGQRTQFKVIGDPEIAESRELLLTGRFRVPQDQTLIKSGMVGKFIDDTTNISFEVWNDDNGEVDAWRSYEEYLAELH